MKVKSLFIISKSDLFLKATENYFKKIGISVFTISNTVEALHFISDLTPDVVVVKSDDFLKEEINSLTNVSQNIILLQQNIDADSEFKQIQLPIDPAQLIMMIEQLYKV